MKLAPIGNPHADINKGKEKKTKAEEKEELIMRTKMNVLEKYGRSTKQHRRTHDKTGA